LPVEAGRELIGDFSGKEMRVLEYKVKLTDEQKAILEGSKGETLAKVMESLVRYGELFGATEMVPISSKFNHLVTSFGLKALGPVYELMDKLLEAGAPSGQKFTVDPKPLDPRVPSNPAQDLVFKMFMYSRQKDYEKQLKELGLLSDNAFTCTCYMDEVGNKPGFGEVLSWSESSAVVYANSVLGARCNRNSGIIDLMGSVIGYVPKFGLLTDEGRKADWIIEIKTEKKPEAQLLGSAIGMKVMEDVPYVIGLDKWIGNELDDEACTYLKDFGAATASNGAVGLYHIDGLTPEAVKSGKKLIKKDAKTYVIDDSQYLMAFEMFDRAKELGYNKFTDVALNFRSLVDFVIKNTPADTIVYFLHHTETTDTGKIKAKTSRKMLDNQLTLEGLFSIVLLCKTDGQEHYFETQSDGYSTCKSPMGMFDLKIDNDLKMVDDKIREYYELNKKEEKPNEPTKESAKSTVKATAQEAQ